MSEDYESQEDQVRYCSLPEMAPRALDPGLDPGRAALIIIMADKWVNGTVLHYYFFDRESDGEMVTFSDGTQEFRTWKGPESQMNAVRKAFDVWKGVGIGIKFEEVSKREDAEIRIGFMVGDGSWSFIGRQILDIGTQKRTMNIGWNISNDVNTAVHEIGHTLGFPHEHQNPNAGIVWNEEAVYTALGKPPNNWSRDKTFWNIIRKINPDEVQGSSWDPDSIMHYPFGAGLIKEPPKYKNGLHPAPGLSDRDRAWVQTFYPPEEPEFVELKPFASVELEIGEGEQKDFVIRPDMSRNYEIQTFGVSDTVVVLFEKDGDQLRYLAGDDDGGEDYNAHLRERLFKDREYVLRIRLYWSDATGRTAVMLW